MVLAPKLAATSSWRREVVASSVLVVLSCTPAERTCPTSELRSSVIESSARSRSPVSSGQSERIGARVRSPAATCCAALAAMSMRATRRLVGTHRSAAINPVPSAAKPSVVAMSAVMGPVTVERGTLITNVHFPVATRATAKYDMPPVPGSSSSSAKPDSDDWMKRRNTPVIGVLSTDITRHPFGSLAYCRPVPSDATTTFPSLVTRKMSTSSSSARLSTSAWRSAKAWSQQTVPLNSPSMMMGQQYETITLPS